MSSRIEIKYGDLDLFLSGVFLASADKEIQIDLFYNNDTIKFILVFDNSDPSKGLYNRGEVTAPNTLKVTFFNHTDTHTTQPLYVGGIGNRKLYWLYRVTQLSKSPKAPDKEPLLEIIYSFYLGSEGPLG